MAAFLRQKPALQVWERWRDSVDWNSHFDQATFSLLPLIQQNIRSLGGKDSLMPRFSGIRRQAWLANQLWVQQMQEILTACAQNDIALLFLPPTRHLLIDSSAVMDRKAPIHVAVRMQQAEHTIKLFLRNGWRCAEITLPRNALTGFTVGRPDLVLCHDNGLFLELTWGPKWRFPEGIELIWERAISKNLGGQTVHALDAADALEFELRRPLTESHFARIIDMLLIASEPRLNWDRLDRTLRKHPLQTDWHAALEAVKPIMNQWAPPVDLERWVEGDAVPSDFRRQSFLTRGTIGWKYYRESLGKQHGLISALNQLPGYLMGRWNLSRTRKIPLGLLGWVIRG